MVTIMSPPLLLLLLVLSPGPGGVPCLADRVERCARSDKLVGQSEVQTIHTEKAVSHGVITTKLYVIPEQDFQGVSLEATDERGQNKEWFELDEKCFATNNTWSGIMAAVLLVNNDYSGHHIGFTVKTGGCSKMCTAPVSGDNELKSLTVVAYGASKWKVTRPPRHCNVKLVNTTASNHDWHPCQALPSLTTTTTTTPATPGLTTNTPLTTIRGSATPPPTTSFPVVWVAVGVVGVVVVVVGAVVGAVVVVRKRKRHDETPIMDEVEMSTVPAEPANQTHVIDNEDIYEPYAGPGNTAAAGRPPVVIDNEDIYEPYAGPGNTATAGRPPIVIDNEDVYEPCHNYKQQ